ncbi:MAG: hypothetical protein GY859_00825 [Desulfobacterales bacterium]|nr:hypothetical protein [Desulfobacterales bacterium]
MIPENARYCLYINVKGHRGDSIILKTARTLAADSGRTRVIRADVDTAAELALPHRIHRQPLQDILVDVEPVATPEKR